MSDKPGKSEGRGVQSIEIGNQLLEALGNNGEAMMLKDLAAAVGMAPAQAHPYLVSYRNLGMVEKDSRTGRYQLGPFAIDLAVTRMRSVDPMQLANQAAVDLSLRSGLTVLVSVWGPFGPTVVFVNEGEDQVHMNTRVGTAYSVTGTATGRGFRRLYAAGSVAPLQPRGFAEIPSGPSCRHAATFLDGGEGGNPEDWYRLGSQPACPRINAVAAPVFDHLGQVLLVMTLVGDAHVLDRSPEGRFALALSEATRQLSDELGYRELIR